MQGHDRWFMFNQMVHNAHLILLAGLHFPNQDGDVQSVGGGSTPFSQPLPPPPPFSPRVGRPLRAAFTPPSANPEPLRCVDCAPLWKRQDDTYAPCGQAPARQTVLAIWRWQSEHVGGAFSNVPRGTKPRTFLPTKDMLTTERKKKQHSHQMAPLIYAVRRSSCALWYWQEPVELSEVAPFSTKRWRPVRGTLVE
ncbi:hypothetical protein VTK73DRAFT_5751 [Phialemonium thermophilum]|uniref:Uncharacterized protein n=1 Tax=Phialemonium thermophilum TaxID=223376 RepID=A0ABR3WM95_9PEZI